MTPGSRPNHLIFLLLAWTFLNEGDCRGDLCAKTHFDTYFTQNEANLVGNNFTVNRVGSEALHLFRSDLKERLAALPANSHVIDMGAGQGLVLRDWAADPRLNFKAKKLTAVGIKKPKDAITEIPGRDYRYLEGQIGTSLDPRKFRTISPSELGPADLIVDLQGAFAYSRAPDEILAIYLNTLKPGGVGYICFSPHLTTVNNSAEGLGDWLAAIKGAKVEWVHSRGLGMTAVLRVTKTGDAVSIPPLTLEEFIPGTNDAYRTVNGVTSIGAAPARRYGTH